MTARATGTISRLTMGLAAILMGGFLAQATGAAKPDNPNRRVCKILTPTGSRLVERVCRTQADWDLAAKTAQDGLFKQQVDGMVKPVPDSNAPGIDRPKG